MRSSAYLLLQTIDQRWREHLHDMDYLQHGIGLRGLAQLDPLVAYKNEAFTLFGDLMNLVWMDFARMIFHVQVTMAEDPAAGAAADSGAQPERRLEFVNRRRARELLRRQRRRGRAGAGRGCGRRWSGRRAGRGRPGSRTGGAAAPH